MRFGTEKLDRSQEAPSSLNIWRVSRKLTRRRTAATNAAVAVATQAHDVTPRQALLFT